MEGEPAVDEGVVQAGRPGGPVAGAQAEDEEGVDLGQVDEEGEDGAGIAGPDIAPLDSLVTVAFVPLLLTDEEDQRVSLSVIYQFLGESLLLTKCGNIYNKKSWYEPTELLFLTGRGCNSEVSVCRRIVFVNRHDALE